ncbi:GNAT family N-acetyltransferase [Brevibacillus sp. HB1.3]|uniref:GNAT family N-acetyltransferase n=1 Tax=Brevibacillus sp. HB1.3 TaxID=2738842 RepID=UPI0015564202|nr:GNAT family N-acetyltransferase [Brevibacillus sp. HB1.3]NQF14018.1 GNAT family N-acetyltransferase [Brevibacillus sp. HB1.3]
MSDEITVHPVAWPPAPIKTERLVLRQSEARDRAALIDLFASPEVGTYVGGSRPRDELECALPEVPGQRFGFFVVELNGTTIGMITLDRRDPERKGHILPEGGEPGLGYMFLPQAWGRGYATEASAAVLAWFADAHPGEPVVLSTQTANEASMRVAAKLGFTEVERFEDYGAEQWLGVWYPGTPSCPTASRSCQ